MWVDFEQTLNKDGMGMAKMQYKFHEVNLLGFDNLTSGVLIPEDKPIDIKESTVNEETIKIYGGIKINEDYSEQDLNRILNDLYSTNFFKDVQVELSNNILLLGYKKNVFHE